MLVTAVTENLSHSTVRKFPILCQCSLVMVCTVVLIIAPKHRMFCIYIIIDGVSDMAFASAHAEKVPL